MEYRKLGSTSMMVSRIGFGGIPILGIPEKDAIHLLRRSFGKGINFVDTHVGYGDSEIKIGKALKAVREQYYLATKIARHNREGAHDSLKSSLKRLDTDYLDLLFIKNLDSQEDLKQSMAPKGSLKVGREAQKGGVVRHIGFTSHTEQIAWKALNTGEYTVIMYPYNLLNRSAEKRILPYCKKHNIAFVCMKPFAGGLLTTPSKVFKSMTRGKAVTTAAAAIRFCLSHPAVTTVIPGIAAPKHLREALTAIHAPMTQRERGSAVKKVAKIGKGFCRNCGYCKPCPQGIDINNIFRFYHYFKDYDLRQYARIKYKGLKVKANACTQCRTCQPKCPYNIDIPAKLRQAHQALARVYMRKM